MSKLMVSVSGIRGIVGDSLTPEIIISYTYAFLEIIGRGTVIVGRDSRVTGEMVENFVIGTLLSAGCKVINLGIVPTPTIELTVTQKQAKGGIIISASHNPPQWNALKFVGNDGMFLRKDTLDGLINLFNKGSRHLSSWDKIPSLELDNTAVARHIEKILSIPFIDIKTIREKGFHVVLDTNHGAGGPMGKMMLEQIGCKVTTIGLEPTGQFIHQCEPLPQNLTMLGVKVKELNADIGFAIDPDGDRVAIVSEKGVAIGEEYTLAIATKCVLQRVKGPVTLNLSTSRMSEDIAKKYNQDCFRTPVGEINVSSAMKENGSVIGGEGNGGAMLPSVLYGRDAYVGIILCLQFLIDTKKAISEAISCIPSYTMLKEKIELGSIDADRILKCIEDQLPTGEVNRKDGLRISWSDSWIHIRKSNTEPILRIIIETKTEEESKEILKKIYDIIEKMN